MAASAETPGRLARVTLNTLFAAAWGCLTISITPLVSPALADGGVIYVNAPQGYSSTDLGSTLAQSLAKNFRFTLAGTDTDREIMQRIAVHPHSIGLVQRDLYVQYLRDHADRDTRFEFYGNIPVCLMAVVQIGRAHV